MIINSYRFGIAYEYLLDTYTGSSVAYSLRKLSSTYSGSCIRVRRSSDNTEQDIGFVSNVLDTASLLSFVGSVDGFVTTWYDQSGNVNNSTQSTASNQFRIVSSGTIETDGGKPALNTLTKPPLNLTTLTTYKNAITVAKVDTQNLINYIIGRSNGGTNGLFYNGTLGGVDGLGGFDGSNVRTISGEDLNRHLGWYQMKSSNLYVSKDGASETNTGSFNVSLTSDEIGGRVAGTNTYFQGKLQEIILYNVDNSANKTSIESQINTFYGIY